MIKSSLLLFLIVLLFISEECCVCKGSEQLRRGGSGSGSGSGSRANDNNNNSDENKISSESESESDTTTTTTTATATPSTYVSLHNGIHFPLVGIGVGNLQQEKIVSQIVESIQYGTRLIDTAHSSQNEALVLQGIVEGLDAINDPNRQMHVVTKIWYTYLGYECTQLAVREIMEIFKYHPNINVHLLIHWPRCRDEISWMECEQEEDALPSRVKEADDASLPPHLNKDYAYQESWRALEDIYLGRVTLHDSYENMGLPKPASIGVSNFDVSDLEGLEKMTNNANDNDNDNANGNQILRVVPHIIQSNVWNYIYDPYLITYCNTHQIQFQAYNMMNGIFTKAPESSSPKAYDMLLDIATKKKNQSKSKSYSPQQLVMTWLLAQQPPVSIIPRTTALAHVQDNSERVLSSLIASEGGVLTEQERETVRLCVSVMLKKEDLDPPFVTFHNKHTEILHIYWSKGGGDGSSSDSDSDSSDGEGEERRVTQEEGIQPGAQFKTHTYPGHTFVAYDSVNKKQGKKKLFTVGATYGQKEDFHVEL